MSFQSTETINDWDFQCNNVLGIINGYEFMEIGGCRLRIKCHLFAYQVDKGYICDGLMLIVSVTEFRITWEMSL